MINVNEKGAFKELPFLLLYGKYSYLYHELQLFKEENPMGFHFIFSFTTAVFGLYRTKYAYAPESNGFSSKSPLHTGRSLFIPPLIEVFAKLFSKSVLLSPFG